MDLFQPDSVLAPQFFATLRRQAQSKSGEWRLVAAVLEDAIYCFQKYLFATNVQGRRLFREACEWMMNPPQTAPIADGDNAPGFSFEYVCDVLGIDPDYLRRGLRTWRDEQVARGLARILTRPGVSTQTVRGFETAIAAEAPGVDGAEMSAMSDELASNAVA